MSTPYLAAYQDIAVVAEKESAAAFPTEASWEPSIPRLFVITLSLYRQCCIGYAERAGFDPLLTSVTWDVGRMYSDFLFSNY